MTKQQILDKYQAIELDVDNLDIEKFFTDAESDMDDAISNGSITEEEYCEIEMALGF